MGLPVGSWGSGAWGAGPFGGAKPVVAITGPTAKKSGQGPFIPPGSQLVPLTNSPNQSLVASLNVDGKVSDYFLNLHYNELAGYWVLTMQDSSGDILLDSVPLITGNNPAGNILGQFAYMGLGSAFIISASSLNTQDYPGLATLGTAFVLVWSNTPIA